jgi:hypothetical protein
LLPGRSIERKLRLSSVRGKLAPPRAISLDALRQLTLPGSASFHLRGDEWRLILMI